MHKGDVRWPKAQWSTFWFIVVVCPTAYRTTTHFSKEIATFISRNLINEIPDKVKWVPLWGQRRRVFCLTSCISIEWRRDFRHTFTFHLKFHIADGNYHPRTLLYRLTNQVGRRAFNFSLVNWGKCREVSRTKRIFIQCFKWSLSRKFLFLFREMHSKPLIILHTHSRGICISRPARISFNMFSTCFFMMTAEATTMIAFCINF